MASELHMLNNIIYKDSIYGDIIEIFYVIKEIRFSVSSNGDWLKITSSNNDIVLLDNNVVIDRMDFSILTLLEININQFKESLEKSLKNNDISIGLTSTFPYELIVLNGLSSE